MDRRGRCPVTLCAGRTGAPWARAEAARWGVHMSQAVGWASSSGQMAAGQLSVTPSAAPGLSRELEARVTQLLESEAPGLESDSAPCRSASRGPLPSEPLALTRLLAVLGWGGSCPETALPVRGTREVLSGCPGARGLPRGNDTEHWVIAGATGRRTRTSA